jgi:uncharacterized OB-fold protein
VTGVALDVVRGGAWQGPVPDGEAHYGEFFEAAARGRLLVQSCPSCGHRQFYPRALCTACGADPDWLECAGTGTVHTFTVVRQYGGRPFADQLPYVLAMVDLPEGVRMFGTVTDVDVDAVTIGMPVTAYAREFEDGRALVYWRPT